MCRWNVHRKKTRKKSFVFRLHTVQFYHAKSENIWIFAFHTTGKQKITNQAINMVLSRFTTTSNSVNTDVFKHNWHYKHSKHEMLPKYIIFVVYLMWQTRSPKWMALEIYSIYIVCNVHNNILAGIELILFA